MGKNGNEIKTAGEDKVVNLPFNIAKNKTIDIGIGDIDPNRFVYGYTVDADINLAVMGEHNGETKFLLQALLIINMVDIIMYMLEDTLIKLLVLRYL
jgi:hypothetical protein